MRREQHDTFQRAPSPVMFPSARRREKQCTEAPKPTCFVVGETGVQNGTSTYVYIYIYMDLT